MIIVVLVFVVWLVIIFLFGIFYCEKNEDGLSIMVVLSVLSDNNLFVESIILECVVDSIVDINVLL